MTNDDSIITLTEDSAGDRCLDLKERYGFLDGLDVSIDGVTIFQCFQPILIFCRNRIKCLVLNSLSGKIKFPFILRNASLSNGRGSWVVGIGYKSWVVGVGVGKSRGCG